MTVTPSPIGGFAAQFFDNNGVILSGGKIYTYAAGTTTPQAVYTSSSGATPHANPIILDSAGRVPGGEIWLTDGLVYKFVIETSTGILLGTYDNITGGIDASAVTYDPPFANSVVTNVEAKLAQYISVDDFGAVGNGVANDTAAFVAADASIGQDIYTPVGTYNIDGATVLSKRYFGPGVLNYSGIGARTFTGAGLNDATFTGSYNGNRPLQIVIKINSVGTPDTLAYSFNGGVTFVTTEAVYNPVTDAYDIGPINIVAGPMQIFGTGTYVTFASTTGHTINNFWAFALNPELQSVNTNGTTFSVQGSPFAAAFGVQNTQLGIDSFGNLNSVGSGNTAIGFETLKNNTVGFANTAVGALALRVNTTGGYNQAIGNATLVHCTTGSQNTAIGVFSGYDLVDGVANTGVGVDTNRSVTSGDNNTAVGVQSAYQNQTGDDNTSVGVFALRGGSSSLPIGLSCSYNTAMGVRAQYEGTGSYNSAFGHEAGYTITGNYNTSIGAGAGTKTTAGDYNVFVGYGAGANASQALLASSSIAIGDGAYTTGSNAVAIGSGVSSPANVFTVCNATHTFFRPSTDNVTALGGPANRWSVVYSATGTINTSDERQKQQTKPIDASALRAWAKVEYVQFKFNDAVKTKGDGARWHFGLIAQQVKEAFESEGLDAFEYGVLCHDKWEGGDAYGIRYEEALALECAYLRSKLT
jgi:hypothetical protein